MAGPLDGIRVLEIGQALAGPLAGAILGDMGADVIKIEKPDGGDDARLWGPPFVDGDALFFHAQNRNKRSANAHVRGRPEKSLPEGRAIAATTFVTRMIGS